MEDLLKVKGMKRETWLKVSPFFRMERRVQLPSGGLRFSLETKRPKPRGILEGNYAGGPLKVYTRGRVRLGDRLEVGFLSEKDPGEERIDDLLSSYIYLQQNPQSKSSWATTRPSLPKGLPSGQAIAPTRERR